MESWVDLFNNTQINLNEKLEKINLMRDKIAPVNIYPSQNNILKCFELCEKDQLKVVLLGQDPYYGFNQATGLSFGISNNVKLPPSLNNIKKELKNDLNVDLKDTSLENWAKQGVLLLNSSLTVIHGKPGSHIKEWSEFTNKIIAEINKLDKIVFIIWGQHALNKMKFIDSSKHYLIISSHPSPLSCNKKLGEFSEFIGSKPFSKCNEILNNINKKIINW